MQAALLFQRQWEIKSNFFQLLRTGFIKSTAAIYLAAAFLKKGYTRYVCSNNRYIDGRGTLHSLFRPNRFLHTEHFVVPSPSAVSTGGGDAELPSLSSSIFISSRFLISGQEKMKNDGVRRAGGSWSREKNQKEKCHATAHKNCSLTKKCSLIGT